MGMGDGGLGIAPTPQSPIPNPQSPIPNPHGSNDLNLKNLKKILIKNSFLKIKKFNYNLIKNYNKNIIFFII